MLARGGARRDGPRGGGGGGRERRSRHLRPLAGAGPGRRVATRAERRPTVAVTVEAVGLTKTSSGRQRPAVDHVDLATEEGEYLVLLGPSGCGKTTLLRMIAGLEQPTDGEVRIGGDVVNGLPPRVAPHRHGVPELRAVPAQDGPPEHRVPAEGGEDAAREAPREGGVGGRAAGARATCSTAGPGSSRAASASGWRWPGPWCATRACSCSTSPCPTSTPSCGRPPATT